ncbi:N-acetyltransferase O1 (Establishment of cohesion protein 1) [Ascosphaera acerosa]|nr:N-acetyltransferase O1 (Establishment of cohesion protein 1) [Ascosphaera acerosa]
MRHLDMRTYGRQSQRRSASEHASSTAAYKRRRLASGRAEPVPAPAPILSHAQAHAQAQARPPAHRPDVLVVSGDEPDAESNLKSAIRDSELLILASLKVSPASSSTTAPVTSHAHVQAAVSAGPDIAHSAAAATAAAMASAAARSAARASASASANAKRRHASVTSSAAGATTTTTSVSEATADDEDDDEDGGRADAAMQLSTPPSSPPASELQMTPPTAKARKPAFGWLKKRRDTQQGNDAAAARPGTGPGAGPRRKSRGSGRPPADTDASATSRRSSKADPRRPKGKPAALRQTQLDLGTSTSASASRHCKDCGMDYVPANEEDARTHAKYHHAKLSADGVDLGRAFIKANASRWIYEAARFDEGYVVIVDRKSSPAARNQARKVLEVVHEELGAAEIAEASLWGQAEPPAHLRSGPPRGPFAAHADMEAWQAAQTERADRFKVFLHMKDSRCVGLCLAERIWEAHPVARSPLQHQPPDTPASTTPDSTARPAFISSSLATASAPEPAIVGISRIWTSASARRKGIAMDLLDCVRSNYIYGMEIPKEQIAFSQPTESGCRLIQSFYGDDATWHVYQERL